MPIPSTALDRVAIAARIQVLRTVLDDLWAQSEADRGEPFECIGRCKVELVRLEGMLRQMDLAAKQREAGIPSAWQQATGGAA